MWGVCAMWFKVKCYYSRKIFYLACHNAYPLPSELDNFLTSLVTSINLVTPLVTSTSFLTQHPSQNRKLPMYPVMQYEKCMFFARYRPFEPINFLTHPLVSSINFLIPLLMTSIIFHTHPVFFGGQESLKNPIKINLGHTDHDIF